MERPIWQRVPWQELAVEVAVVIGLFALNLVLGILGGVKPVFVSLIGIGTLVLLLAAVALYEYIRSPLRRRVPTGKEVIAAVDAWLGNANYRRGRVTYGGFSDALEIQQQRPNASRLWIGVEPVQNTLWFMCIRTDEVNELLTKMTIPQAVQIKLDLGLEIARMGAFYETQDFPKYTVTFWDTIPIDQHLDASKVLGRVFLSNGLITSFKAFTQDSHFRLGLARLRLVEPICRRLWLR